MIIFKKSTNDEGLYGIDEEIYSAIEEAAENIPKDENGFNVGTFTITVSWSKNEFVEE